MEKPQADCEYCGQVFTKYRSWQRFCCKEHRIQTRHQYRPTTSADPGNSRNRITPERIEEAKRLYPSLTRNWDLEMVEKCWARSSHLIPRRLNWIDSRPSAMVDRIQKQVDRENGQADRQGPEAD